MQFQVLGDVKIVVGGQVVSLPSRRQEQLLALLVRAEGRAVTGEKLADALWGRGPACTPARTCR